MLSSYFVAAVEWRVNYAFKVSQIPGFKVGAHSVFVVTLQNGNGGEHHLLIDAVADKVRLRLLPPRRMGEWRHRSDPGTAVLFKRAQLSDDLYKPGGASSARDAHSRASEGGVCCSPVRAGSELWERVREGSVSYDPGTQNCHHFARDLWNYSVVKGLKSMEMPTELAQDVLMAASLLK